MQLFKIILFACLILTSIASGAENIVFKNFETDFCTMFKEGTNEEPNLWKHCCIKHDLAYWVAGSKNDMKRADSEIKNCVEKSGKPFIAKLMYSGIKLGHFSPIKNKYKWGWAHDENRKTYQELSVQEIEEISLRILEVEGVDTQILLDFLDFRFPHI
jgi:hypothetical protein